MNQRIRLVLIGVLAVVVVGVGAFATLHFVGGATAAAATEKAGDCVTVSRLDGDRADIANAGCDSAMLKIGEVLADPGGKCPTGGDDYLAVVPRSGQARLCLLPNFVAGACYQPVD